MLEGCDEPKDAWDYLKCQHKMLNACALDIARSKIGRLRLRDCKGMRDYSNEQELLKLDIIEAERDI